MLVVFLVIIVVVVLFFILIKSHKKREKKEEFIRIELERQRNIRKMEENRIVHIKKTLIDKYGQPSKIIDVNKWKEYDPKKYIIIFAEASIVYLDGQEMAFAEISSFKIVDNYQIKHGKVIGKLDTKTNTGSLIGRSIGGVVLGGGVGAVIGASSASKTTTAHYLQENDQMIHNYTLVVGTICFEKPTIHIRIGDNWEIESEIEVIFNLILEKNKKS